MQRSGSCRRPMALSRLSKPVRILGIESSCDETAAAVVEDGEAVLSSVVASQMDTHGKYGGVVPELASREHLRAIVPVVREALERSGTRLRRPGRHRRHRGAGPGGIAAGGPHLRQIAELRQRRAAHRGQPHRGPHSCGGSGSQARRNARWNSPRVALVVSGGHTHLFEVREGFRLPPARQDARRRRGRGFRQSGQAAGLRLSRRPGHRPAGAAWRPRGRALHLRQNERQRARFQLQRPQDRRAALGGIARHGKRKSPPAAPCCAKIRAPPPSNGWPPPRSARWTCWLRSSAP